MSAPTGSAARKQVDMHSIRQVNHTFKQAPKAKQTPDATAIELWDVEEG